MLDGTQMNGVYHVYSCEMYTGEIKDIPQERKMLNKVLGFVQNEKDHIGSVIPCKDDEGLFWFATMTPHEIQKRVDENPLLTLSPVWAEITMLARRPAHV